MLGFSADEIEAVRLSLRVAFWAMLGSLPFGIATAMVLARGRFWGKSLLDGIVHLPLVMPPVVTGYLCCCCSAEMGRSGGFSPRAFGIVFAFRWTGAALACAVMGFPLMVRAIRLSLEAVDRRLEEAAGTLGAGRRLCVLAGHAAVDRARDRCRHGAVLCPQPRRVRRDDHFRVQHPRRDADDRLGDLHADPDAGGRSRRAAFDPRRRSRCRWLRCSPPRCWRGASAGVSPATEACSKSTSSTGSPNSSSTSISTAGAA